MRTRRSVISDKEGTESHVVGGRVVAVPGPPERYRCGPDQLLMVHRNDHDTTLVQSVRGDPERLLIAPCEVESALPKD